MLFNYISKINPLVNQIRHNYCYPCIKPFHLICFKEWTAHTALRIIWSAINLKCNFGITEDTRLDILKYYKVMILQEVNEPMLNKAVSMATTLLGANVSVVNEGMWKRDYSGCILSSMADAVFVSTATNWFLQRFVDESSVPVMCMMSRTHATMQSLATIMAIIEEFRSMCCLNVAYVGPPHPVLNSYILLCALLGANIKFKCCRKDNTQNVQECPVSPLLYSYNPCAEKIEEAHNFCKQCKCVEDALFQANVIISGPTASKKARKFWHKEDISEFSLSAEDISEQTCCRWIHFYTCPIGKDVKDELFEHSNSRTSKAFDNLHYIAAALLAYAIRRYLF